MTPETHWPADDAVRLRTSLRTKFPANREINREFCSILHFDFDVQSASEFNGFQPNSYATEQGIFKRVSGNFFRRNREISPLRPATAQRGLSTVGVGVGISRNSSTLKPTDASVTIRPLILILAQRVSQI
jgi:hypothetical protein